MRFQDWWKEKKPVKPLREWGKMEKLTVLLVAGLLLVLFAWPNAEESGEAALEETSAGTAAADLSYEEQLEQRLEAILSQVEGAGEVQVMVTLKDGGEKVLQENTSRTEKQVEETDSSGGVRRQTENSYDSDTLLSGGSDGTPYVIQERVPEVEGVLVLADGADSATVKAQIAEVGYLNYISREDTGQAEAAGLTDISEEDILLENQAAGAGAEETEGTSESQAQPGEAVFTCGTNVVEFMSEISLNKEQVRARNKEALLEIVNNENISAEQKQEAIDTMVSMTTIAEKENAAETQEESAAAEESQTQ